MTLNEVMQETADAIREKTGKSEPIAPIDFATEIKGITAGGGSTIKYLDVSGLEDKTTITAYCLLVKTNAMGNTAILSSGVVAQFAMSQEIYMSVINGTLAVAIDESLEVPHPTTFELVTFGDIMREAYGDAFSSLPSLTKEEFYTLD